MVCCLSGTRDPCVWIKMDFEDREEGSEILNKEEGAKTNGGMDKKKQDEGRVGLD